LNKIYKVYHKKIENKMPIFFGKKYVKGITQFIPMDHFGPLDFIDYHATKAGVTRDQWMATFGAANAYMFEGEKKPGPDPYMKDLDKEEQEEKEEQMKKQAKMADDDPAAYKEMPGSEEAREKGKVKTSTYTKKYHELYGDNDKKNESTNKIIDYSNSKNKILVGLKTNLLKDMLDRYTHDEDGDSVHFFDKKGNHFATLFDRGTRYQELKHNGTVSEYGWIKENMLVINEADDTEQKSTDRGPLDDDAIETGLKNKSEETGVPIGILRAVMRRGLAAWKTGHRPGATQQQWGYARVNSFLTKGEGTWGKADADLAKEVRDSGKDGKLKKG